MIYINPQVKQLSKPMQDQHKNVAYWHMIVKLLKTKIKRKIFKADRRKKTYFFQEDNAKNEGCLLDHRSQKTIEQYV